MIPVIIIFKMFCMNKFNMPHGRQDNMQPCLLKVKKDKCNGLLQHIHTSLNKGRQI